jgi:hypothetical protein
MTDDPNLEEWIMADVSTLYIKGIYDRFNYLPSWLPNTKLKLGDVGIQQGGTFKRMTSLRELSIPYKIRHGKEPVDFTYTSQSGISNKAKLAGELAAGTTIPLGKAGILVEFSQQGAFLFQAVGCLVNEIEDRARLGEAIISLHTKKRWDPAWSVVDTLVKAERATILVSNSNHATLELTAKTQVAISNLADAETGLTVSSQQGDIIRFLAAKGLTPLFKLSRLKKSLIDTLIGGPRPIYFGGKVPEQAVLPYSGEDLLEMVAPE